MEEVLKVLTLHEVKAQVVDLKNDWDVQKRKNSNYNNKKE